MNIFPNRKTFIPEITPQEIKFNIKIWNKFFINCNNLSKLKLTNIGIYSMSKPKYAKKTIDIIKSYFKKDYNIVVTESSANMGGDTIMFAQFFDKVNSVEILKLHYDILKNNLEQYNLLSKVNLYNKDYLDIMYDLKQDVIYIDAPWGGKDYKLKSKVDLYLDNVNIIDIANTLIEKTKIIVLKVPINYNIEDLYKRTLYMKIDIYKIKKNNKNYYNIIILH